MPLQVFSTLDHTLHLLFLWSIRQSFDDIFPSGHAHDRNTGNLTNPPLEVPIVCGDDVDFVFLYAIDDAIISIDAFVVTRKPLPAGIPRFVRSVDSLEDR